MMFFKRRSVIVLKVVVLIIVFGLYFIVLIKESMHIMENGKNKLVAPKTEAPQQLLQKESPSGAARHKANKANAINNHRIFHQRMQKLQQQQSLNQSNYKPSSVSNLDWDVTTKPSSDDSPFFSSVNPIYEYSEEINAEAEQEFEDRRQHLWDVCEREQIIDKFPPNAWEFFLSPGHGLAWCNVFKAASSTWMYYFNILAGYDLKFLQRTRSSPLELARKRFPRPTNDDLNEALENSISFLIVREPFERLLSAYRNKLEGSRNKYYKLLGEQIVKKFRKRPKTRGDPTGPTFREFLQFLIQHYRANGRFDEHWSPIHQFCTPCSINFTIIAKVETFKRDSEYIIRQAGLDTILFNTLPKRKIGKISNKSTGDTKSLIPKYFSQIDQYLLKQILEIYALDFELFGYDSSKYFKLVQNKQVNTITHLPFKS